ncbi:4a-hydroxytetrahydrobiopterin dehydratase [Marinibactrum halimedae]|uniref:Putative pterin-4-alpha-carbinolamine dehydratase n=1 Tax=Marinibactrum halimedae TaxID=1444977 RepID=A0AA37TC71_9GAMM|nr:4a-hydroxytetrahydrobiopterin dehydratase [Marinibactrum halimedae]MCD9457985.1 4a-hydroxytetrahydrobiopterin dehydratase [Marinibactrum halimedae]GLS27611.1 putative pterin-4-alpha-carbinolamine dehydratase [Marinibactrum halimedae]
MASPDSTQDTPVCDLADQACEACKVGAPLVEGDEAQRLLAELPGWEVVTLDGVEQLKKEYTFKNFRLALELTNKIGALAEEYKHHPGILTEWGKVTVTWWTHKIGGLHKNDFIMAAKTDSVT